MGRRRWTWARSSPIGFERARKPSNLTRLLRNPATPGVASLALTIVIGAAILWALRSIAFVVPMGPEPRSDFEFGPMESGIPAVQSLGKIGRGFAGVSVLAMQTDGEAPPAFLTMRLRGGEPPQIVREGTIAVPRGPEFATVHFDFEPVAGPALMYLEIVALTSGDAEVFLGGTKNDRYPDGLLRYRDEPQFEDLDLALNLYRHTTVWRLLTDLRSRAVTGFVAAAAAGLTAVALVSVLAVWAAGSAIGSFRRSDPR